MKAKITYVGGLERSRNGGVYKLVSLQILQGCVSSGHVYLNPESRNYSNWESVLEEGNLLTGLVWRNKKKRLIDGDSPVENL